MKTSLALLAAFIALPSIAENQDRFAPYSSNLRIVKRTDSLDEGHTTRFAGRVTLTGMLVFEFDRDAEQEVEQPPIETAVMFVPSEESRKKLPRAVGRVNPSEVKFIYLGELGADPDTWMSRLFGKERARKMLLGRESRYEVPARIVITSFETLVQCDSRSYSATVASIKLDPPTLVAKGAESMRGC